MWVLAQTLLLIIAANGAPVIARRALGDYLRQPVDCGWRFADGRALLGGSKTWAGLVAGVAASALLGPAVGLPARLGAAIGLSAMAGDLLSSFIKRRLGRPPSARAVGLDQIPESLAPALVAAGPLALTVTDVAFIVVAFCILELVLSRLLYIVGVRKHPY